MTKNVTLTYTDEMKEQDALWENEQEDLDIMESLFHELVNEAKENGYTGIARIYRKPDETICELFQSEDELTVSDLTDREVEMYGYCKPLLHRLEDLCSGVPHDIESRFETLDEEFLITYVKDGSEEVLIVLTWSNLLSRVKEIKDDAARELVSIRQIKQLDFLG